MVISNDLSTTLKQCTLTSTARCTLVHTIYYLKSYAVHNIHFLRMNVIVVFAVAVIYLEWNEMKCKFTNIGWRDVNSFFLFCVFEKKKKRLAQRSIVVIGIDVVQRKNKMHSLRQCTMNRTMGIELEMCTVCYVAAERAYLRTIFCRSSYGRIKFLFCFDIL